MFKINELLDCDLQFFLVQSSSEMTIIDICIIEYSIIVIKILVFVDIYYYGFLNSNVLFRNINE